MTDARDDLAALIHQGLGSWPHGALFAGDAADCRIDLDNVDLRVVADVILAAGWVTKQAAIKAVESEYGKHCSWTSCGDFVVEECADRIREIA